MKWRLKFQRGVFVAFGQCSGLGQLDVIALEGKKLIKLFFFCPFHKLAMTDAQSLNASSILWGPNWNIYNNIYTFTGGNSRPAFQGVMSYDVQ